MLVTAYVLYDGTTSRYVGDANGTIQINCERLQAYSPRPVWLKRELAPGDGSQMIYTPTFQPTSAELLDANILQGFWIEQDGKDAMIDIASANALILACDACCGAGSDIVTRFYTGGTPAFTALVANNFCITRSDDGTTAAHGKVALDYMTQIFSNPIRTYWFSGTSRYQVQSFYTLAQLKIVGTDVIVSGICAS